ncbi:toll-like receptor 4 [Petromyzon marinus]|uniref:toll-like receptor 4 n=1 Tax=Petromyzon marinus TaxID=7757 RepID=UPI003F6F5155
MAASCARAKLHQVSNDSCRRVLKCISLLVLALPVGHGYGLRNCKQMPITTANCVHRNIHELEEAISDLRGAPVILNLSNNALTVIRNNSFIRLGSLIHLRMDINHIYVIEAGAFNGLSQLQHLNLSFNNISRLIPGAFNGLVDLKQLIIDNNRLEPTLEMFKPLKNVIQLSLTNNGLSNFSQVVEAIYELPLLQSLNLESNRLTKIIVGKDLRLQETVELMFLSNNSIESLSLERDFLNHITSLDLFNSSLTNVSELAGLNMSSLLQLRLSMRNLNVSKLQTLNNIFPKTLTFAYFPLGSLPNLHLVCRLNVTRQVMSLTLTNSYISNVSESFCNCREIQSLDLSFNRIKSVEKYNFLSPNNTLRNLTLNKNQIEVLESCVKKDNSISVICTPLPYLENVFIKYNNIFQLESYAFVHMKNLRKLDLTGNDILRLSKRPFHGLHNLSHLVLANNVIRSLNVQSPFSPLENLKSLMLRNNRLKILNRSVFSNLTNLEILDLGGNALSYLHGETFSELSNLKNLYLDRNAIRSLDNRAVFAGLHSLRVLDLVKNMIVYNSPTIRNPPFVELNNLINLKLSAQQPYGMKSIPKNLFKGLYALEKLQLGGNKLLFHGGHPFDGMHNLKYLDIHDVCSGLQIMNKTMFYKLKKLSSLDLGNDGLGSINNQQFQNLTHLETLYLNDNAIRYVTEELITPMTNLKYLDLRNNPIDCTCDNAWFKNWSFASNIQVTGLYTLQCEVGHGFTFSFFVDFDTSVCHEKLGKVMFISTTTTILLTILIPLVYAKVRWHIIYGYYMFRAWFRDYRRNAADKQVYTYDAFISYNSMNEDWVMSEMVPQLEKEGPPFFKLCVHHRDFVLGKYIVDNIVDAIYNSRKTICVVSESYLLSEWCSMEIQMASYRLFNEHKDVLIMVFLETIPSYKLSAYYRMRRIVNNKTYIVWPDDNIGRELFWAKLRTALGRPTPSGREQHELP